MGVMRAIRNPKGLELALEGPIDVKDALDILSLLSFLFRQIDKSVYYGG
ncbi:MAG: TIGR02391 family protein [Bacillota bacterium]